MKNIAIIPARSGSKGLPNKNIKNLNGIPLLAYSIKAAEESGQFEEIMVSTDSEEYANIARQYGAQVPFLRSEKTSGDAASSWDMVAEVLEKYNKLHRTFDTIALLQPTSPLRTANDIVLGYELLNNKKAKSVISVCEMDHSPLYSNVLPIDHNMQGFIPKEIRNKPRQAFETYYRINGALYILSAEKMHTIDTLYDDNCYAYVMDRERSIDIDTSFDFMMADLMMNHDLR